MLCCTAFTAVTMGREGHTLHCHAPPVEYVLKGHSMGTALPMGQ